LECDRDAGQRSIAPSLEVAVDRFGACQRAIRNDGVEGVELRVEALDAGERLAAGLGGRTPACPERVAHLANGRRLDHPITRGTLKRPASTDASGAFARASARSRHGRTSSARSAAWRVTTLAVGGMPVVSIC